MTIDQFRQYMAAKGKLLPPEGTNAWDMVESFLLHSDLTGLLDFLVFICEVIDNRLQFGHLKVQEDLQPKVQVTGYTEPLKNTPDASVPLLREFHIGVLPENLQKRLREMSRYRETSDVEITAVDPYVEFVRSKRKHPKAPSEFTLLGSPADLADRRVVETKQFTRKAWPPRKEEVFLVETMETEYEDGTYGADNILAGMPESSTVHIEPVDTPHETVRLLRDLIGPLHEVARQLDGIIRVTDAENSSVLRTRLKNKSRSLTGKRRTDECNPSPRNNEVNAARRILRSKRSQTQTKRRVG